MDVRFSARVRTCLVEFLGISLLFSSVHFKVWKRSHFGILYFIPNVIFRPYYFTARVLASPLTVSRKMLSSLFCRNFIGLILQFELTRLSRYRIYSATIHNLLFFTESSLSRSRADFHADSSKYLVYICTNLFAKISKHNFFLSIWRLIYFLFDKQELNKLSLFWILF